MPTLQTDMSISQRYGTAALVISIDGVLETTHTYEGGIVTLDERPNVALVSNEGLATFHREALQWVNLILTRLAPPRLYHADITFEQECGPGRAEGKMKFSGPDGAVFFNGKYDKPQDIWKIKPRPETPLDFEAYRAFVLTIGSLTQMRAVI